MKNKDGHNSLNSNVILKLKFTLDCSECTLFQYDHENYASYIIACYCLGYFPSLKRKGKVKKKITLQLIYTCEHCKLSCHLLMAVLA